MVLDSEQSIKQEDGGRSIRALIEYTDKAREIRARIFALPSADSPNHLVSKDFVYEACRIVAIIYAQATVEQEPFSKTAMVPLIDKLHEALKNTDLANVWNDMAGVPYWVCAVGAAAAQTTVVLEKDPLSGTGSVITTPSYSLNKAMPHHERHAHNSGPSVSASDATHNGPNETLQDSRAHWHS
jgi:hypothetical protein